MNHSAMSLLRATVLLFLLTSSVLAWTLALADNVPSTIDEMIDESYSDDTTINGDSRINEMFNEATARPSCPTDYTKMSTNDRKMFQTVPTKVPVGVCVRTDGAFIVTTWIRNLPFVYMHDKCDWMMKRIDLPRGTLSSGGCAYSDTKLYYSDTYGKKILQFSIDGTYEKIFATGYDFLHLKVDSVKNLLLASIQSSRKVFGIIMHA